MPTVAQLRQQLKKRGLDTKGKKAELEARLQAADEEQGEKSTAPPPTKQAEKAAKAEAGRQAAEAAAAAEAKAAEAAAAAAAAQVKKQEAEEKAAQEQAEREAEEKAAAGKEARPRRPRPAGRLEARGGGGSRQRESPAGRRRLSLHPLWRRLWRRL